MGAKMQMLLRLRSSEGKVLVAPAWDDRPATAAALPLETGVPLRALEKAVLFWVRHALVEAIGGGCGGESLADDWDAHFLRCLQQDGLTVETVAAAVKKLRLHDALAKVVPDFDLAGHGHRPSTSAAEPEPSASASHSPARSDPEATTLRAASPDRAAAASRARGRRREEDEADQEPTRSHRKARQTASAAASATDDDDDVRSSATSAPPPAAAPAAKTSKIVITDCLPAPAPRKMTGPSLRRRRGLPELHALQVSTAKLPS